MVRFLVSCSAGLQAGTGQLASGHAFTRFARLSARLLLPVAPAFRPAPAGLRQGTPSRRESEQSLRAVIPNGVRNLSERFLARHGGLEMVTESLGEAIRRLPAVSARLLLPVAPARLASGHAFRRAASPAISTSLQRLRPLNPDELAAFHMNSVATPARCISWSRTSLGAPSSHVPDSRRGSPADPAAD